MSHRWETYHTQKPGYELDTNYNAAKKWAEQWIINPANPETRKTWWTFRREKLALPGCCTHAKRDPATAYRLSEEDRTGVKLARGFGVLATLYNAWV